MDLRAEILKEHSRVQSDKIAKWIGKDAGRFAQLVQLFLHDEYRVVQRAAWVLSVVVEKHYHMAEPHLPAMVKRMTDPGIPVAVKRNVVRILQFIDVPEALHGDVMNMCFELLGDPQETIAVRAFSMTVLANLAKHYPDIKQELRAIIEDALEQDPSPGFKNRAHKTLAALAKK
jgi:hypothetical protein